MACTIATNGARRNRAEPGPAVPLPRKLQPASRKMGACPLRGLRSPRTSRTRDRGPERGAETESLDGCFCRECIVSCFGDAQGFMTRRPDQLTPGPMLVGVHVDYISFVASGIMAELASRAVNAPPSSGESCQAYHVAGVYVRDGRAMGVWK